MIYFLETNKTTLSPKELEPLGLAYIRDAGEALSCKQVISNGPGGKKGLLFCNRERFGLDNLELKATHRWSEPFPGLPAVVRVAIPERPTPEQLQRKGSLLTGYVVTDARGQKWQLPLVRRVEEGAPVSALPCYLKLGADGELVAGDPIDEFRYLWDASQPAWDAVDAYFSYERALREAAEAGEDLSKLGEWPSLDTVDVLKWLTTIIAANYVVGACELVELGAFEQRGSQPLTWLLMAIGYSEWLRRQAAADEQKKTAAAASLAESSGSNTADGEADAA